MSNLALKLNLDKVDKIDIDKLKIVHVDLSKLSSVVNNKVVKKTMYDKLVVKVNNIDTVGFASEIKYDTEKSDLEKESVMQIKKIPDTSKLGKKQIIMQK